MSFCHHMVHKEQLSDQKQQAWVYEWQVLFDLISF